MQASQWHPPRPHSCSLLDGGAYLAAVHAATQKRFGRDLLQLQESKRAGLEVRGNVVHATTTHRSVPGVRSGE